MSREDSAKQIEVRDKNNRRKIFFASNGYNWGMRSFLKNLFQGLKKASVGIVLGWYGQKHSGSGEENLNI